MIDVVYVILKLISLVLYSYMLTDFSLIKGTKTKVKKNLLPKTFIN